MDSAPQTKEEQSKLWNGPAAQAWVDAQPVLDQIMQPFEDLLVEAVVAGSARCVLDIGCGTGTTTLAVARRLNPNGHTVGIDISEPMIAAARVRAERDKTPAAFIVADAQDYPFEPGCFHMIISRFGVMFFADFVQAFANLRRAAEAGAELRFIAWRAPEENPFMTAAERAAAPFLPNIPTRQPNVPGPFAFADPQRLHRILHESGWTGIDIQPLDVPCTFAEKDLMGYVTRIGPLGQVLQQVDDSTRGEVIEKVREGFSPFVHGAEVRFTAACWTVGARA